MTSNETEQDVWAAIADQRIAMLTVEEAGRLVSRPMAAIARPEENRIYFVTRLDSKVGEIGGSAPVNLGFADPHKNTYLSLSGTARTSQDREKLRALWSMWIEAWLPEGPDGADVALVSVEPEEAKLWDSTSSMLLYAGKVLKAVVTRTPPDGGRVEQVEMGANGGTPTSTGTALPEDAVIEAYDRTMRDRTGGIDSASLGGPSG